MHTGFPIRFRALLYEQTAKDLQISEETFQLAKEQPDKHQIPRGGVVGEEGMRRLSDMIMHWGEKNKKNLLRFL